MIEHRYHHIEFIAKSGDLLSAPTEVIVNPANKALSHGGGLARQIAVRAGPDFDHASSRYIAQQGLLSVGDAVATTAGRLPFRAVIHCVGPIQGVGNEEELIRLAMTNAFKIAIANDWQTIAFPAISTGIFRVPIEVFAAACRNTMESIDGLIGFERIKKVMVFLAPDLVDRFAAAYGSR